MGSTSLSNATQSYFVLPANPVQYRPNTKCVVRQSGTMTMKINNTMAKTEYVPSRYRIPELHKSNNQKVPLEIKAKEQPKQYVSNLNQFMLKPEELNDQHLGILVHWLEQKPDISPEEKLILNTAIEQQLNSQVLKPKPKGFQTMRAKAVKQDITREQSDNNLQQYSKQIEKINQIKQKSNIKDSKTEIVIDIPEVQDEMVIKPPKRTYRAFKHGHPGTGYAATSATMKRKDPFVVEPALVIPDVPMRKYVPQPVKNVENLVIEYLTQMKAKYMKYTQPQKSEQQSTEQQDYQKIKFKYLSPIYDMNPVEQEEQEYYGTYYPVPKLQKRDLKKLKRNRGKKPTNSKVKSVLRLHQQSLIIKEDCQNDIYEEEEILRAIDEEILRANEMGLEEKEIPPLIPVVMVNDDTEPPKEDFKVIPPLGENFQDFEHYGLDYNLMKTRDPDEIYRDVLWFQKQLNKPGLSQFQKKTMKEGLQQSQNNLKRYLVYENFKKAISQNDKLKNSLCQFEHTNLISVQKKLKNILDIYDKSNPHIFIHESAKFIAEGMDYICNAQLAKRSCDVIYQYQYIMRSELFVEERSQILSQLIPLIKHLKEEKYNMVSPYEKVGQTSSIQDLQILPDDEDLRELQQYFETKQKNVSLTSISQELVDDMYYNNEISVLWSLDEGNALRMGSPSEQAIFLIKWAQEEFYLLHSTLIKYIPSIQTDLKSNVIRVAQKIKEEEEERGLNEDGGGYQFITDILRAKLMSTDTQELKNMVTLFENIPGVKVIKYKPKFYGVSGTELRNVTINFVWSNSFICELQVRLGSVPALEPENHFLYEIERVNTPLQLLDAWNTKLTEMAKDDELFYQL